MEQALQDKRLLSLDIMRGILIACMILANNPGGQPTFVPLEHAEWIGLTPIDIVFPSFMFIMGITTYLSLRKTEFRWSRPTVFHILKRALLLWLVGLVIAYLYTFLGTWYSDDCSHLPFGERFCTSANVLDHLRILGVLPRLGICYGLAALTVLTVKHRYLPLVIAILFIVYFIILINGNGFVLDETNILYRLDKWVMGDNHMYFFHPDPEGILSTLPSLANVLIGFCIGRKVMNLKSLDEKVEHLFTYGSLLLFAGLLLSYACPISKKLWTPTFAMTACGFASILLALLANSIDRKSQPGRIAHFFQVFGVNPLALYVVADLLAAPISAIPFFVFKGKLASLCNIFFESILQPLFGTQGGSLVYALLFVLLNWFVGLWLFKKKIYIKL